VNEPRFIAPQEIRGSISIEITSSEELHLACASHDSSLDARRAVHEPSSYLTSIRVQEDEIIASVVVEILDRDE
jgi:hypothetical protein